MAAAVHEISYEQAMARIAKLEAELQQAKTVNRQLLELQQVGEMVSASLNTAQIFDAILYHISRITAFDSATLMLVEGKNLRAVAARGFPNEAAVLNVYPRNSQNSAWRVVDQKAPLIIDDVQVTDAWESRSGLEAIRAWIGIPLIVKSDVIGVLTLDAHEPNAFTEDEANLIFTLSYQVAIAVENASLYEAVAGQHQHMSELHKLNQIIASIFDLDQLLQTIIEQITQMLGSHWCVLWIFDETGNFATTTTSFGDQGLKKRQIGLTIEVNQHPIARRMLSWLKPLIVHDVDPDNAILVGGPTCESLLVIPLRYQEKNIGFILTDNTEKREAFLSHRVALAVSAANQAALSIGAAKLFDELQKQADRLRLINEVARQITTILNVDDLLSILVQAIHDRLNYSAVSIFEVDQANNRAILKAITGQTPNWLLPNVHQQDLLTGAIGAVVQSGQPALVKNVKETPEYDLIANTDYVAGVVVPVYIHNRLEALISVQSETVAAFNEHDIWTLETLSQQAAIAVENARLYRDITQRLEELAVLHDAGQAFISTLDLDEMLAIIMERTCAALAAEYGYVLLTNEARTESTFVAAVGEKAQSLKGRRIPLEGTIIGTVVRQGKALRINDTSSLPQFLMELDSYVGVHTQSLMVAPLTNKGKILGALLVTNKQREVFSKNNLNLLTALGQLASGTIENARLFRQVQRYTQDLKEAVAARTNHLTVVNETSRAISSLLTVDDLFDNVTRLISQLFDQARVSVGLRVRNYIIFQKVYDGEFEANQIRPNHRLPLGRSHLPGQVVLSGETRFLAQISTAELYQLTTADGQQSKAMVVPLTIGGKTIGVIVVQSQSGLASPTRDQETLEALASQVAVAMENARLLKKAREIAIEQERTRLARDMHDGVAQNLAYLLLQVDRCLAMVEEDSHPKLEAELENMSQVISHNIEELRRHIFDLRPVGLEGQSIFQALCQMIHEFGRQLGLKTHCDITGDPLELPPDVEASLYRVFQEALSNIRRHARCTDVSVTLESKPDKSLSLTIEDNGQGFDPDKIVRSPLQRQGLGLVSMEERVRNLGGTFTINSAPGQGTTISLYLPNLTEAEAVESMLS